MLSQLWASGRQCGKRGSRLQPRKSSTLTLTHTHGMCITWICVICVCMMSVSMMYVDMHAFMYVSVGLHGQCRACGGQSTTAAVPHLPPCLKQAVCFLHCWPVSSQAMSCVCLPSGNRMAEIIGHTATPSFLWVWNWLPVTSVLLPAG